MVTRAQPSAHDHPLRQFDLMERYRALREEDMRTLQQEMQKPGGVAHRPCPACDEDRPEAFFRKEGFDFARCRACGCVYLNPVPNAELLDWYYDRSSAIRFFYDEVFPPSLPHRRPIFAERVEKLKPYIPKGGSILEVGTSVGLFVEAAKNAGYAVSGVEPNKSLAHSVAETYKADIANCFIEDYRPAQAFDAAVIWEVIEHVTAPKQVLEKIHSLLKPRGVLAMTLPNLAGIEFGLCGPGHEMIEGPSHINYFTPQTLTALLKRCGFEAEVLTTPGILDCANVINHIRREQPALVNAKLWPQAPEPADTGGAFLLWLMHHFNEQEHEQFTQLATAAIQRARMSGNMFVMARRV